MRSTVEAIGVLSLQFAAILFCAGCALAVSFGPLMLLGYVWITGMDDIASTGSPLWLPILFLFAWIILIKILSMSLANFRNFSWRGTKKIAVSSVLVAAILIFAISRLP